MSMPLKEKQLFFWGLCALTLIAGAFSWIHFFPSTPDVPEGVGANPGSLKAYWVERIKKEGGAEAYGEFKSYIEKLSWERKHVTMHIIGEALFDVLDVEGVTVCDSSVGFACFHGFFGRAVSVGGPSNIEKLDRTCVEAFGPLGTGCQHGIGHGILEYTGYERLNEALSLCKQTTQLEPLLGCTSGVFMEYNTPLVGIGDGLVPQTREFDASDPYAPCPSVPAENQASCYFELGQWFLIVLQSDYERAGDVCGELSGELRTYCFLGVGSLTLILEDHSVERSLAVCAQFSEDNELSCRAGVSWALYADPEYTERAAEACPYINAAQKEKCLTLADLTNGRESND
jgi:hypothetical protein